MRDIYEAAQDLDECDVHERYRAIARFAKRNDCKARVVTSRHNDLVHVLVINPAGEILATRSATRLAAWLGY